MLVDEQMAKFAQNDLDLQFVETTPFLFGDPVQLKKKENFDVDVYTTQCLKWYILC